MFRCIDAPRIRTNHRMSAYPFRKVAGAQQAKTAGIPTKTGVKVSTFQCFNSQELYSTKSFRCAERFQYNASRYEISWTLPTRSQKTSRAWRIKSFRVARSMNMSYLLSSPRTVSIGLVSLTISFQVSGIWRVDRVPLKSFGIFTKNTCSK